MSDPAPAQPLLPYERPMAVGELRVDGGDGGPVQVRWAERTRTWGHQVFWLALFTAGSVAWLGYGLHSCLTSTVRWTRWFDLPGPGAWSFMTVYWLPAIARTRVLHRIMQADREIVRIADNINEGALPTSWVRAFEIEPRPGAFALVLVPFPRPHGEVRWYQLRWERPPKLAAFDVVVHGDEGLLRGAARELNALLTCPEGAAAISDARLV